MSSVISVKELDILENIVLADLDLDRDLKVLVRSETETDQQVDLDQMSSLNLFE